MSYKKHCSNALLYLGRVNFGIRLKNRRDSFKKSLPQFKKAVKKRLHEKFSNISTLKGTYFYILGCTWLITYNKYLLFIL